MPPTAAPAWLEAAAKVSNDAPADRVPLAAPGLKVTPVPEPEPAEDLETDGVETDVVRRGYVGRALWPGFAVAAAATAACWFVDWEWLPRKLPLWAALSPVAALWLVHLTRWAYRVSCVSYRLTTRRLFRDQGGLYPREDALDLATLARAQGLQNPLEWVLFVGRVRVVTERDGAPELVLSGVSRPRRLAAQIETLARVARGRNVVVAGDPPAKRR
jgi:hypothetical protein